MGARLLAEAPVRPVKDMEYTSLVGSDAQRLGRTLPGPVWIVVDDDVRDSISFALQSRFEIISQPSCEAFLNRGPLDDYGVVILDIHSRGMDGLSFMAELAARRSPIAVIFLAAQPEVRTAVDALKAGAANFFEKPVDPYLLAPAIEEALAVSRRRAAKRRLLELLGTLSLRERQIFEFVCQGRKNTEIAEMLFLSQRTIEVHRTHIARKLGANGIVRLLYELSIANNDGIFPTTPPTKEKGAASRS